MAALPYIQLYVADYLADTMHLTTEEHGAYLLLIMNYWQTGKPIPKARLQKIARLPSERWATVEDSLSEFFTDTGTEWVHERIERDLDAVHRAQEQKVAAGKASAEARKRNRQQQNKRESNDRSTTADDLLEHEDNETSTNKDTDTDTEPDTETHTETHSGADRSSPEDDSPAEQNENRQFPLKDGTTFEAEESYVSQLQEAHPHLNIEHELRRARLWLVSNPGRRKTRAGMKRFLTNWMSRQKASGNVHPISSRHNGFDQRDYSKGLKTGVGQNASNF